MVVDRNDRPHRAKGLPRGYAGTFDTTATGTGGDDVAPPVDETRPENRIFDAGRRILADPDVMECAQYATVRLDAMIDRAAGPDETDDLPLIVENLRYDPEIPGGSRADYLAGHVLDAFRDARQGPRPGGAGKGDARPHPRHRPEPGQGTGEARHASRPSGRTRRRRPASRNPVREGGTTLPSRVEGRAHQAIAP